MTVVPISRQRKEAGNVLDVAGRYGRMRGFGSGWEPPHGGPGEIRKKRSCLDHACWEPLGCRTIEHRGRQHSRSRVIVSISIWIVFAVLTPLPIASGRSEDAPRYPLAITEWIRVGSYPSLPFCLLFPAERLTFSQQSCQHRVPALHTDTKTNAFRTCGMRRCAVVWNQATLR
jgi:hypothetical protein